MPTITLQVISEQIKTLDKVQNAILTQAKETNGRVTKLELAKSLLMGVVIGGHAILGGVWAIFTFII